MGTKCCITDNQGIIVDYIDIHAYLVGGVEKDVVAVACTGKGFLLWYSEEDIMNIVHACTPQNVMVHLSHPQMLST